MKKGPDPFFTVAFFTLSGQRPAAAILFVALLAAAACGDVDVYVNTAATTTTLPRDAAPPPVVD